MVKKRSKSVLLVAILTIVALALNILVMLFLGFNIMGFKDMYAKLLQSMSSYAVDIESEVSFALLEMGLTTLIYAYFSYVFIKYYLKLAPSFELGRRVMSSAIWFLILTFSLVSIIAMIVGSVMAKKFSRPVVLAAVPREPQPEQVHASDEVTKEEHKVEPYKLKAMAEAVERLNELKRSGAISEEEYYEHLDKILEG